MPRHAQNNTAKSFFTHQEKADLNYGTQTKRMGQDGGTPFGHCWLSLQPVVEPVASPSGHLYSREAILEYLVAKKDALAKQRDAYNAQQAARAAQAEEVAGGAAAAAAAAFAAQELSVASARGSLGKRKREDKAVFQLKEKKRVISGLSKAVDDESYEQKRQDIKRTSWWLPEFTPEGQEVTVPKPPKRPPSPVTGRPLRLKDLVPVRFAVDTEADALGGSGTGRLICAVSKKQLSSQPTVLIAKSGEVMLASVFEKLAKPTMTCPVTGKTFKPSDVILLRSGASGFAGGGAKEVSVYKPALR